MSKQIKIVHVSDDNCDVSLNVGSINGVQEGDKFLVYSLSDHEIVDPDTGESLGYLEFVKGTGEVVHVQDKMCTITSVTYRKPVAKKTILFSKTPELLEALAFPFPIFYSTVTLFARFLGLSTSSPFATLT